MRLQSIPVFLLAVMGFSCETTECCLPIDLDNIFGEYIVYEYGYSPGDRYIVEEVPAEPAQLLTFDIFGGFSSNYQGLTEFIYYRVYDHPTEGKILGLFKDPPPLPDEVDLARLNIVIS